MCLTKVDGSGISNCDGPCILLTPASNYGQLIMALNGWVWKKQSKRILSNHKLCSMNFLIDMKSADGIEFEVSLANDTSLLVDY